MKPRFEAVNWASSSFLRNENRKSGTDVENTLWPNLGESISERRRKYYDDEQLVTKISVWDIYKLQCKFCLTCHWTCIFRLLNRGFVKMQVRGKLNFIWTKNWAFSNHLINRGFPSMLLSLRFETIFVKKRFYRAVLSDGKTYLTMILALHRFTSHRTEWEMWEVSLIGRYLK